MTTYGKPDCITPLETHPLIGKTITAVEQWQYGTYQWTHVVTCSDGSRFEIEGVPEGYDGEASVSVTEVEG